MTPIHIDHETAILLASLATTLQTVLEARKRSQQASEPRVPPLDQRPTDRPALLDESLVDGHRDTSDR